MAKKTKEKKPPSGTTTPRSQSDASETNSSSAEALLQLLSPDGYYSYLNIPKPAEPQGKEKPVGIDEELVKKNYRRKSLKHHPDRKGGDAETFRVLKRAQVVLLNSKLREEYDILGIDLDDDEHHEDGGNNDTENEKKDGEDAPPPVPETLVSHMATSALAFVMQLGIRTVMMAAVSVFLCRWRITVYPALAFLAFIAFKIQATVRTAPSSAGASYWDMLSPLLIGAGLICLHKGRDFENDVTWSYTFWIGEALVMTMFTYNSIPHAGKNQALTVAIAIISVLLTLWLRGLFWRYLTVIGMEAFVAIVVAMAFPLMELVLEEVLKEKLRKVGEKVRANAKRMEEFYASNER